MQCIADAVTTIMVVTKDSQIRVSLSPLYKGSHGAELVHEPPKCSRPFRPETGGHQGRAPISLGSVL